MIRKFIAAVLCMCSSLAVAGPDQINVVGIIPGVTTKESLIAASTKQVKDVVYLEIGGYSIPCLGEFEGNVLGFLNCVTGDEFTEATNLEIHETLVKGFIRKFGGHDENFTDHVRNGLGVEYQVSEVWWVDKKGNALILKSMADRVDQGSVMLFSKERFKKMDEEREREDKARKF